MKEYTGFNKAFHYHINHKYTIVDILRAIVLM